MSRRRFSKKSLDKLLASFNGKCRMCQVTIDGATGLEFDHRIPLALGGEDELGNLEPLCIRCHRTKTKGDVTQIAKATRQRQRNLGIRKPAAKIPSPPRAPKREGKTPLSPRPMFEPIRKANP